MSNIPEYMGMQTQSGSSTSLSMSEEIACICALVLSTRNLVVKCH